MSRKTINKSLIEEGVVRVEVITIKVRRNETMSF